jgi:hypothetical protein
LDVQELRFFNIGMRKSEIGNSTEAYRTIAGSKVEDAIDQGDARAYRRGHWYGSGLSNGERVTIGLSSAAKLWSNKSTQIPELITWCRELAAKLTSARTPQTFGGLDLLPTGDDLTEIPTDVIFADWDEKIYGSPCTLVYPNSDGQQAECQLHDLDLRIDYQACDDRRVVFEVGGADLRYRAIFSLDTGRFINAADEDGAAEVRVQELGMQFDDFLNHYPPIFYTANLGSFQAASSFPPIGNHVAFEPGQFEVCDWGDVDILTEYGTVNGQGRSIHDEMRRRLIQSDAEIVFYDHGPGELADFVSVTTRPNQVLVDLYHCKASSAAAPGQRVQDAYEVCGQAVKSNRWSNRTRLVQAIRRRAGRPNGASRFEKGAFELLEQLLDPANRRIALFQAVIVQPGFSRAVVEGQIGALLAAADGFLFDGGRFARLKVLGSA